MWDKAPVGTGRSTSASQLMADHTALFRPVGGAKRELVRPRAVERPTRRSVYLASSRGARPVVRCGALLRRHCPAEGAAFDGSRRRKNRLWPVSLLFAEAMRGAKQLTALGGAAATSTTDRLASLRATSLIVAAGSNRTPHLACFLSRLLDLPKLFVRRRVRCIACRRRGRIEGRNRIISFFREAGASRYRNDTGEQQETNNDFAEADPPHIRFHFQSHPSLVVHSSYATYHRI